MRNAVLAVEIAFIMTAPATFVSAQSLPGYIKTEGTKQGQFKGESRPKSGSGATSKDLPITKKIDKTSPNLMQSSSPLGGSTGPTVPPKPTQGNAHK
jgi:hypothetical protein